MSSMVTFLSKGGGRATAVALVLAAIVLGPTAIAYDRDHDGRWVVMWTASPQPASSPLVIDDQTLRQVVHVSIGGRRVRVRLSTCTALAICSSARLMWPSTAVAHRLSGEPIGC